MADMDDRSLARAIAAGRLGFGLVMLFVPNLVLKRVADERPGPLVWMCRAFGIRDAVLGAGALLELAVDDEDDTSEARWVTMGAVADTSDAVAALLWRKELGWSGFLSTWGLAIPAAAGGWKASIGLRRGR
jgi:hypothetical protein